MTTEKSDPNPSDPSDAPSPHLPATCPPPSVPADCPTTRVAAVPPTSEPKDRKGIHYLSRLVNGSKRMTPEVKGAFAGAMEKGFMVGRRIQLMFALRDAVTALRSVTVPPPSGAVEIDQADPVLQLLDEAGDAAKEFIEACGPILALVPQLGPVFQKLDDLEAFLKANRVITLKRTSLTAQQLVGVAVARMEDALGGDVRVEPKELVEFFKDIDLFDGAGPDAPGWEEVLWKMRHRRDEAGNTIPDKIRGRLLDALELAAKNRARKDGGQ